MPVRFADVDHAGIVYYPRFFHYFHVAFEEMFIARLGGGDVAAYQRVLDERKIGFPAVHAEADYKAPLRFGDLLEIELTVPHVGTKSTFKLLEALAGAIAAKIQELYPHAAVAIELEKLAPPCPGVPAACGVKLHMKARS